MPRYEEEGFRSKKRVNNDNRDRTVPIDDMPKNSAKRYYDDSVRDNQVGVNPCNPNEYSNQNRNILNDDDYGSYYKQSSEYQSAIDSFESERPSDFDNTPRVESRSQSRRPNSPRQHKQSSGRNGKGANNGHKRHHISLAKRILIFILVLILIIVGSIFPVLGRIIYDDKKENTYVTAADLQSSALVKNILLLGVDARDPEDDTKSRADTMMLISIDMKHHCIKMTSFLRDTWLYIPCNDGDQRLNAACQYGGYSGVVDTIEYNFGVEIDGYVVADFEMFKILVDSIGGVEVEVSDKEAKEVTNHPKRYGDVTLESGKNKLTGEQALAYCRIRKIDTDFVRTKRQRTVMNAIFSKMKRTNPFSLYKMAFSAAPYIETDLTKGELMSTAAKAAVCMSSTHQTKVPFENTWEYATIRGNSVISINVDKNKEKLQDFIFNKTSAELTSEEAQDD